jgi:hypothetical protein
VRRGGKKKKSSCNEINRAVSNLDAAAFLSDIEPDIV